MNIFFNKNVTFFSVMFCLALTTCSNSLQAMITNEEMLAKNATTYIAFSTTQPAPNPESITIQTASGLWIAISQKTALQPEYKNILLNQYGITVDEQGNPHLTQATGQINQPEAPTTTIHTATAITPQRNSLTGKILKTCLVATAGYGIYTLVRFMTQKQAVLPTPELKYIENVWSWE